MTPAKGTQDADTQEGLGELFFRCLNKYGNRPVQFIADTNQTDTCDELLKRCVRVAINLKQKNIRPGDVIGLSTYNHINSCVPLIASQFLGAITANFDFNVSREVAIHLLRVAAPKIVFVDKAAATIMDKCIAEAGMNCEIVVFESNDDDLSSYSSFSEYLSTSPEEKNFLPYKVENMKDTAMILFSSGTTGYPKGICLNHFSLIGQILNDRFYCQSYTKPGYQTVYLMYTNLYWITAVASLIKSIKYGGAKVICSKFDGAQAWKLIEKYKVTNTFFISHLAAEFVANRPSRPNINSLSVFYTGATKISEKLMKELIESLPNVPVLMFYGQTEVCGTICCFKPNEFELQKKYLTSCGKIHDHYKWKIVDTVTEKPLGQNQEGELRLKVDYIMNGYYKLDSSNAFDSEGYLKTGDIVYYNEDGCFFVVDRIKEMFKCRGNHIIPSVLEDVLFLHPAVKDAAVIGIPHDTDEHHPMGVVTLKEGQKATPEEIEKFVEGKVFETQKLRAGVKIVKKMPRTNTGKIIRSVIKNKILNNEL